MISHHNGVKIELDVSYNAGVVMDNPSKVDGNPSRANNSTGSFKKTDEKSGGNIHGWIIHEKLDKEKSTNRVIIL